MVVCNKVFDAGLKGVSHCLRAFHGLEAKIDIFPHFTDPIIASSIFCMARIRQDIDVGHSPNLFIKPRENARRFALQEDGLRLQRIIAC